MIPDNRLKLLENIEGLGFLLDTHNWKPPLRDEGRRKLAKYATASHVKTLNWDANGNEDGENVEEAVQLLKDAGYTGVWGIESVPRDGDEIEGCRKTIALLETAGSMKKIRIGIIGCGQYPRVFTSTTMQGCLRRSKSSPSLTSAKPPPRPLPTSAKFRISIPTFESFLSVTTLMPSMFVCTTISIGRRQNWRLRRQARLLRKAHGRFVRRRRRDARDLRETKKKLAIQLATLYSAETRSPKNSLPPAN